jgi:hypothetical protein
MSRHGSRRGEHIQATRQRPAEPGYTERRPEPRGATDAPDARPGDTRGIGMYWLVILLWGLGFATMILFELVAALFRR